MKKILAISSLLLALLVPVACNTETKETNTENEIGEENNNSIDGIKTNAKEELDTYASTLLTENGKLDDGTVLLAVNEGKANIDKASTEADVSTALASAKENVLSKVNAIKKEEVNLEPIKTAAKTSLEEYAENQLNIQSKIDDGTVLSAVNEGKANIDASSTEALIQEALEAAKSDVLSKIDAIKKEEVVDLVSVKTAAKNDLLQYKDEQLKSSGKKDDGTVEVAYNQGLLAIDAASNEEAIKAALNNAKSNVLTAITNIKEEEIVDPSLETLTYVSGLNESIALEWEDTNYSNAHVYYKLSSSTDYTEIDSELIRNYSGTARADILGLKAGTYSVKVVQGDEGNDIVTNNVVVSNQDRSGYAFFNTETNAIGAYNEDGSLKDNADVIYVTNETKNTVTYNGYVGLTSILQNANNFSNPVVVRIIGSIKTNQWVYKSVEPRLADNSNYSRDALDEEFLTNTFETKYGENLVGLKVQVMSKKNKVSYIYASTKTGVELVNTGSTSQKTTTYSGTEFSSIKGKEVYDDDSYFNMLDIIDSSNGLTIEGVGYDAEALQWGITFKTCSNIEVKNMTFTDYPEDACSFEGANNYHSNYGGYWIHNNTFNSGKNNWDLSGERDKPKGDGAMDIKYCNGVTASYNQYVSCKKTGLVGGSDTNVQKDITFHHNYYNNVGSRLPLGRQANMHIYNNYYYNCGVTVDLRANAYALLEGNYFASSMKPRNTVKSSSGYNPGVKSYGDYYDSSCSNPSSSYKAAEIVTSRTATVENGCNIDGVDYSKFDTNSSLFYYDSINQESDVMVLTDAETAKSTCTSFSGVLKKNSTSYPVEAEDVVTHTISFNTNGGNALSSIKVREGAIASLPTPTRSGYSFTGWYTDLETTKLYTSSAVTSDFTLYAGWEVRVMTSLKLDTTNLSSSITTSTQAGDMMIYATNAKAVTTTSLTYDSVSYDGISLGGSGSFSDKYRMLSFDTTSTSEITLDFYIKGGGTENRTLNILDSNGNVIKEVSATPSVTKVSVTVSGSTTYYLLSTGSAISIADLVVTL